MIICQVSSARSRLDGPVGRSHRLWRRPHYVWLLRVGLAGMTALGLELARVDLFATWQWVMGTTCLWAIFAGICLAPIAQLTYEGQPPAAAATTGAMHCSARGSICMRRQSATEVPCAYVPTSVQADWCSRASSAGGRSLVYSTPTPDGEVYRRQRSKLMRAKAVPYCWW